MKLSLSPALFLCSSLIFAPSMHAMQASPVIVAQASTTQSKFQINENFDSSIQIEQKWTKDDLSFLGIVVINCLLFGILIFTAPKADPLNQVKFERSV